MKKTKITIGIPVYNEEKNIKSLIISLFKQSNILISKIIISSDGSDDNTIKEIKSIKSAKIKIINNPNRKGIARGLNQITRECKTKILVTLDADIKIVDKNFLNKLIKPIIEDGASLTTSKIKAMQPKNFFGKMLYISMELKNVLFKNINNGQNIYTCYGLARAYSDKIYKKITFPTSVGNDMYSYLYCLSQGLIFKHASKAVTYYKLPKNLYDHLNQSTRFYNAISSQKKFFGDKFVNRESTISKKILLKSFLQSIPILLSHPIHITFYFILWLLLKTLSFFIVTNQTWKISKSTK